MNERTHSVESPRQLWQPDRHEQMAAVEILLASHLPMEARIVLRELETNLRNPEKMQ